MNLDPFFHAKTIAIIGASREPNKVGNVILRQLMGKNFTLYPVNPNAHHILGIPCYQSVLDLPKKPDLAIIATPGPTVPALLDQLGNAGIRHVVIISAGFKEVGNQKLERDLQDKIKGNNITAIGPNCLGVLDIHSGLDCLFLPQERLRRPLPGGISFISQSGALGSAVLDLSAYEHFGFAKFISYGNATSVDESDLLAYLSHDPKTHLICLYIEGVQNGKKFLDTARACKKPVIVIKGGTTPAGKHAALSHTGSLAGSAEVYFGAFKQANLILANSLEEVFEYATLFDKAKTPATGKRVQVITNGGGYGILTADALVHNGLELAKPGKTIKKLRDVFPPLLAIHNPLDLLGDATVERYEQALTAAIEDNSCDSIIVVILPQTPRLDHTLARTLEHLAKTSTKPILAVVTGSEYAQELKRKLAASGIPTFDFPENAVRALAAYTRYCTNEK